MSIKLFQYSFYDLNNFYNTIVNYKDFQVKFYMYK